MSLNARFLKNPVDFAHRFALDPIGNRTSQLEDESGFSAADLKTKPLGGGNSLYQVQGSHRILFCNIKAGRVSRNAQDQDTRLDGNLCSMEFSPSAQSSSEFPVFWLPWRADSSLRIMLKTSKHETRTTGFFRPRAVAPRVFVTAALSGCSIFVEGDRRSPVVYHLNAVSTEPGALDPGDPDTARRAGEKTNRMEALYRQASTLPALDKLAKPGVHVQPTRSANMRMYMGAELEAGASSGRLSDARASLTLNRALPTLVSPRGAIYPVGDVVNLVTFGTVFGIKGHDDLWTFYYQSRTRAEYFEKIDRRGRDDYIDNWRRMHRWLALSCREFWPNGARQIHR